MAKILVIDDSRAALMAVETMLSEAGYEARTYTSAKRAIEILESELFDLVITDIYMPDMDGLEVIRAERRIRPDVPILAMSGISGPRDMLRVAKHLGACQIVPKPFSKANLLAAVESALGAGRLGAEIRK